jgi:hypothetical protein
MSRKVEKAIALLNNLIKVELQNMILGDLLKLNN